MKIAWKMHIDENYECFIDIMHIKENLLCAIDLIYYYTDLGQTYDRPQCVVWHKKDLSI